MGLEDKIKRRNLPEIIKQILRKYVSTLNSGNSLGVLDMYTRAAIKYLKNNIKKLGSDEHTYNHPIFNHQQIDDITGDGIFDEWDHSNFSEFDIKFDDTDEYYEYDEESDEESDEEEYYGSCESNDIYEYYNLFMTAVSDAYKIISKKYPDSNYLKRKRPGDIKLVNKCIKSLDELSELQQKYNTLLFNNIIRTTEETKILDEMCVKHDIKKEHTWTPSRYHNGQFHAPCPMCGHIRFHGLAGSSPPITSYEERFPKCKSNYSSIMIDILHDIPLKNGKRWHEHFIPGKNGIRYTKNNK